MNVKNMTAACVLMMGGLALGQVLTPPPEKPVTPPEYVPSDVAPPAAPAVQPQLQPPMQLPPGRGQKVDVPDLPWKHWELDERGMSKALDEPLDFAALKRNPMVSEETMQKLQPYLAERRGTFERLVAENADLVSRIEDGMLEKADTASKATLSPVIAQLKPITDPNAPKSLGDELRARGLLSAEQAEFQSRIKKEYLKHAVEAVPSDLPRDAQNASYLTMMLSIYRAQFDEIRSVYRGMLLDAAKNIDAATGGLTLSAASKTAVQQAAGAKTDAEKVAGMKLFMKTLSPEQKAQVMQKVRESRGAKK